MEKILISIIIGALMLFGNIINTYQNETISEVFEINNVENGEIRGELIRGQVGQGEGIYLLENDLDIKINVGDKIKVTYYKDDYENNIWDNILKVEKLN